MSDTASILNPPHAIPALLQQLQQAQPQAQIAVLHFTPDQASIGMARKGVPVHIEHFPQLSLDALTRACFAGPGPTAQQLEQAIELIEDDIQPARLDLRQFLVFASGPQAARLKQWIAHSSGHDSHALSLEQVESAFNLYADATVGAAAAGLAAQAGPDSPLKDTQLGAYLLLLRECLHHLHITHIQLLCEH
ncbi:MAG TPA: hypothetical protein PK461_17015 [Alcaligenes faecalis]|nr:hypothetical protein [Alcaligenes faecalis]